MHRHTTVILYLGRDNTDILRLNNAIDEVFRQSNTHEKTASNLKLCVNEAVANVIEHGLTAGDPLRIEVSISANATCAKAIVSDNCTLFDPCSLPPEKPVTCLETEQLGGFGMYLMRKLATSIWWEAIGQHGNRLTLICVAHLGQD